MRILHHLADTGLAAKVAILLFRSRLDGHRRQHLLFVSGSIDRAKQTGDHDRPKRHQAGRSPAMKRHGLCPAELKFQRDLVAVVHKQSSVKSKMAGWQRLACRTKNQRNRADLSSNPRV